MKKFVLILSTVIFSTASFAQDVETKSEAKVVQIIPAKEKCILILNKGSKAGVKQGDSGKLIGLKDHTFKVTEVYSFRSKAVIDLAADKIPVSSRTATFDERDE